MRRVASALVLLVGLVAVLSSGVAAGGNDGAYQVRAIFDNGGFLVAGEEVRVAGANVGTIASVDVTGNGEPAHQNGKPDPGKAVVVLQIDDPGFQDFRQDASCLIRPQSLLGEKFVECQPTQPHAPGTKPPPALGTVADGDPGAGQRFLPLENNGKAVDLDLVNNIQRLPYAERFRLILNDLGATFAGRGKDLGQVIDRSDPALRVTDEVLARIASQNRRLEQLAVNGDRALTPLARDRARITGFLANANTTAAATAERKPQLEAGFQKLPGFLRELRLTMVRLGNFADQSQPAFADLGAAAPSINTATRALGPFSRAGIPALTSLGDATSQANGPLSASDPVVRQLRDLSKQARPGTKNLKGLLRSTQKTNGFRYIDELFFNGVGVTSLYDSFGHILRTVLPNNNCVDYVTAPVTGCSSNFGQPGSASGRVATRAEEKLLRQRTLGVLGTAVEKQAQVYQAGQPTQSSPTKQAKAPGLDGVTGLLDYVYGNGGSPGKVGSGAATGAPASGATPGAGSTGAGQ